MTLFMTLLHPFTFWGLLLTAGGVILLFIFGMPFRVRSDEGELITTNSVPEAELKKDRMYEFLGYTGLLAIVVGTLLQLRNTF